ncbi:unnamed protein product [Phaeothamnion confervicola]
MSKKNQRKAWNDTIQGRDTGRATGKMIKRASGRQTVLSKVMRVVDEETRKQVRSARLDALEADNYAEEAAEAGDDDFVLEDEPQIIGIATGGRLAKRKAAAAVSQVAAMEAGVGGDGGVVTGCVGGIGGVSGIGDGGGSGMGGGVGRGGGGGGGYTGKGKKGKGKGAVRKYRSLDQVLFELASSARPQQDPAAAAAAALAAAAGLPAAVAAATAAAAEAVARRPTYLTAAAAPSALPQRHFCSVCGYYGSYACTRCGARFCSLGCNAHHKETRCLKFSV